MAQPASKRFVTEDRILTPTGYDIVLVIGQSNASGRGTVDAARFDTINPRVDQFGAVGTYAGVISAAIEPLANADAVALSGDVGLGPMNAFAKWYTTTMPAGRRLLIVPAAYGGTALVSGGPLGWRRGVAGNLYAKALAQLQAAIVMAGSGSQVVSVVWVQGEADGDSNVTGAAYQADFDALITGLRTDLGLPNLPFIIGSMVPDYLSSGTRQAIDTVQQGAVTRLTNVGYVAGPRGLNKGDGNHYSAAGQRLLGRYLFTALRRVQNPAVFPAPIADDGNPAATTITNTAAPAISGTATIGQTLTASTGSWTNSPTGYTYQWYRAGTAISGATSSTYTLVSADNGQAITVAVTATRSGYTSGTATSAAVTAGSGSSSNDAFTRADSTTSLGGSWNALSGTWGIRSNRAYLVSGTSSAPWNVAVLTGTANQTASVDLVGTNVDSSCGLAIRVSDASNYIGLRLSNAGTVQVYKVVAGSATSLGELNFAHSASTTVTLAVTMSGSSLTVKANGTTVGTITETFNQNATNHGMWWLNTSTAVDMDNYALAA